MKNNPTNPTRPTPLGASCVAMRSRAPQRGGGGGRLHPLVVVVLVILALVCGLFYYQSVRVSNMTPK